MFPIKAIHLNRNSWIYTQVILYCFIYTKIILGNLNWRLLYLYKKQRRKPKRKALNELLHNISVITILLYYLSANIEHRNISNS